MGNRQDRGGRDRPLQSHTGIMLLELFSKICEIYQISSYYKKRIIVELLSPRLSV